MLLNKIALAVNTIEHLSRYCILAYLLYIEISIHCYLRPSNIGIAMCTLLSPLLVLCLVTILNFFFFSVLRFQ